MPVLFDSRLRVAAGDFVARRVVGSSLGTAGPSQERVESPSSAAMRFAQERLSPRLPDASSMSPSDYAPQRWTSTGIGVARLTQLMKDIPVFQAEVTLRIGPNGLPLSIAGSLVWWEEAADSSPTLAVEEAVLIATKYLAGQADLDQQVRQLTGGIGPADVAEGPVGPDSRTTLTGHGLSRSIVAMLRYFEQGPRLKLAWQVCVVVPDPSRDLLVLVDAHDAEVLWAANTTPSGTGYAQMSFPDPDSPPSRHDFPQPRSRFPVPDCVVIPEGFPEEWYKDVPFLLPKYATVSGPGDQGTSLEIVRGELTFPTVLVEDRQRVTAWFSVNFAHDYFWALGFRRGDGNFEANPPLADPVDISLVASWFLGTATMRTPAQGSSPSLTLGPDQVTGRHTSLDATVVIHEYTHGVAQRLIGGSGSSGALVPDQSDALNEGWADFFGCAMSGATTVAGWCRPPTGIRSQRYDSQNTNVFGSYGDPHDNGEPWAAALMDLARALTTPVALQVVLDALKATPVTPTFLQARDAVLHALHDLGVGCGWSRTQLDSHEASAWVAFARHGFGVDAQAGSAASMAMITPGFATPTFEPAPYADAQLEHYDVGTAAVGPGLAVCSWGSDRLDLFCTTSTGVLHTWADAHQPLGVWESIGGAELISGEAPVGVAACSAGEGDLNVFEIAADGTLHWLHHHPTDGWGSWVNLGGDLDPASAPGATSWSPGRIDVFGRGRAGQLMHIWAESVSGWHGWEFLPQVASPVVAPSAGITVTSPEPGRLLLVGQDTGQLVRCEYDAALGAWSPWVGFGPAQLSQLPGGPALASLHRTGKVVLYAVRSVPGGADSPALLAESAWWAEDWNFGAKAPHGSYLGLAAVSRERDQYFSSTFDVFLTVESQAGDLYRIATIRHLWGSVGGDPHAEDLSL